MVASLVAVAAWAVPSSANAACERDLVDFGSAITTVRLSLNNGYASGAAGVIDEFHGDIDCLTFAPPPQLWADWLFLVALTRFSQDRDDWDAPLERALALNPNLDRSMIGSRHALYTYAPAPMALVLGRLPYDRTDLVVYVDGHRVASFLPDPDGFHLVQINNGAWWDSMIIEGGDDAHELWVPRRQPQRTGFRLDAFVSAGLGSDRWRVPDQRASTADLARMSVGLRGQLTTGLFAIRGQVSLDETAEPPAYGVAGFDAGHVGVGLGVSAERVELGWDAAPSAEARWYADPVAALWLRGDGRTEADARLLVSLTRVGVNVGMWPQRDRDPLARIRLGAVFSARRVALADPAPGVAYRYDSFFVGTDVSLQLTRRAVGQVAPDDRKEAP